MSEMTAETHVSRTGEQLSDYRSRKRPYMRTKGFLTKDLKNNRTAFFWWGNGGRMAQMEWAQGRSFDMSLISLNKLPLRPKTGAYSCGYWSRQSLSHDVVEYRIPLDFLV